MIIIWIFRFESIGGVTFDVFIRCGEMDTKFYMFQMCWRRRYDRKRAPHKKKELCTKRYFGLIHRIWEEAVNFGHSNWKSMLMTTVVERSGTEGKKTQSINITWYDWVWDDVGRINLNITHTQYHHTEKHSTLEIEWEKEIRPIGLHNFVVCDDFIWPISIEKNIAIVSIQPTILPVYIIAEKCALLRYLV